MEALKSRLDPRAEDFRAARGQEVPNADLPGAEVRGRCDLDQPAKDLAYRAVEQFTLSGRGYDRLLRVARTIADLAGEERVAASHIAEALGFRRVGETG